jgi:hypothetical protein
MHTSSQVVHEHEVDGGVNAVPPALHDGVQLAGDFTEVRELVQHDEQALRAGPRRQIGERHLPARKRRRAEVRIVEGIDHLESQAIQHVAFRHAGSVKVDGRLTHGEAREARRLANPPPPPEGDQLRARCAPHRVQAGKIRLPIQELGRKVRWHGTSTIELQPIGS